MPRKRQVEPMPPDAKIIQLGPEEDKTAICQSNGHRPDHRRPITKNFSQLAEPGSRPKIFLGERFGVLRF